MFFHDILEGQPDAIFGLAEAFLRDPRPHKVNLLMGVYKNKELKTEMMPSVKRAKEETLLEDQAADYLPIDGLSELTDALGRLLFGEKLWKSAHGHIYGAHTVGGTGALRVGAEFVAQEVTKTISIPQPTWPNHRSIFERAGFQIELAPIYDRAKRGFHLQQFLSHLEELPVKSAVLLHAACQNPTGCDPTPEEWREIARFMRRRTLLPFFDCAYQGFGDGIEQDAMAIRHFAEEGLEFLVAYSCAKNFTLYCQRVGALFIASENAAVKLRVASQVKRIIRAIYSNPPAHGARLVSHILCGPLRADWERELAAMRERLSAMRSELVRCLLAKKGDFHHVLKSKGMFSFLDLEKSQVQRLIDQYAIYLPDRGRINVAGLNQQNLDYVVDHILDVIR